MSVTRRVPTRRTRAFAVTLAAAALTVGVASACKRPTPPTGGGWPTTTVGTTPTTDGHGHTDEDHANMTTTTVGTTPTTDGHGHTDEDHANMTTTTAAAGGGHDDGGHGH